MAALGTLAVAIDDRAAQDRFPSPNTPTRIAAWAGQGPAGPSFDPAAVAVMVSHIANAAEVAFHERSPSPGRGSLEMVVVEVVPRHPLVRPRGFHGV